MAIYDRYLTVLFFRVLLVLFSSLCGLFMIIDFFDRLEEFLDITQTEGTLASVALEFYTPRVLSFFDRISGLVTLISAVFVVTWIQRNRELIAIYAGGVSLRRVTRPIVWCVIVVALFGILNREILLPGFKDRLTRDTRNWFGQDEINIRPTYDRVTGVFLNGKNAIVARNEVGAPIMQLPPGYSRDIERLVADKATYISANENHPAGYLLDSVSVPENLAALDPVMLEDQTLVYTPASSPWLEPHQGFLVSNISVNDLTRNENNAVYSSTKELVLDFRNPSRNYNNTSRVLVHARMVQPILDLSLLFIGLPLVVSRRNQHLFLAIGLNLVVVLVYLLAQLCCHALGSEGLVSPSLAAWLPLFLFGPLGWQGYLELNRL